MLLLLVLFEFELKNRKLIYNIERGSSIRQIPSAGNGDHLVGGLQEKKRHQLQQMMI
jgi:hypothetical protein